MCEVSQTDKGTGEMPSMVTIDNTLVVDGYCEIMLGNNAATLKLKLLNTKVTVRWDGGNEESTINNEDNYMLITSDNSERKWHGSTTEELKMLIESNDIINFKEMMVLPTKIRQPPLFKFVNSNSEMIWNTCTSDIVFRNYKK